MASFDSRGIFNRALPSANLLARLFAIVTTLCLLFASAPSRADTVPALGQQWIAAGGYQVYRSSAEEACQDFAHLYSAYYCGVLPGDCYYATGAIQRINLPTTNPDYKCEIRLTIDANWVRYEQYVELSNSGTCPANSTGPFNGETFAAQCTCNAGYVTSNGQCVPAVAATNEGGNPGCNNCDNGTNPINTGWRGNKYQVENDYHGAGSYPLHIERHYNSREAQIPGLTSGNANDVSGRWRHTYQRFITAYNNGANAAVYRPDGKIIVYTASNGAWTADPHVVDRLISVASGWQFITAADETETYSAEGVLLSIRNRAGLTHTLSYNASGHLISVTDPAGRTLSFTYSGNDLATLTDPAGGTFRYTYAANGNLTSVTDPSAAARTYLYENAAFPHALTGLIDGNGNRIATWTYAPEGQALSSEHGPTGNGIDKTSITYNADGSASITDALGTTRSFNYATQFGVVKNTGVSQPCPACGSAAAATVYDNNGFIASRTDFNGNVTTYTHDASGLETSRTEAAGTPIARIVATEWHSTFRLPTQISEPGRTTAFTYDSAGNLLSRTLTDTTTNTVRAWTSTYNDAGQVLSIDGPRSDVSDRTSYAYDSAGNLISVTNALGHVTRITSVDAHGRPLSIIDPNGLITTLAYDTRGRLFSRNSGGEIAQYAYDPAGQLTRLTLPSGAYIEYTYDMAHRLTQIRDTLGNKIVYTLDAMGNRINEAVYDPANTLAQTRSRVFDALNRLQKDIGGINTEVTQYAFDGNGNLLTVTDSLNRVTANAYDALNRLLQVTDPNAGVTRYGYTALDQLAGVTDPRNLTTAYTPDALGNVTQTQSPDAGTGYSVHDAAGNIVSRTDAKGQTTSYQYDALNRLTKETRADRTSVSYLYDTGTNQIGRLTQMTDPSGSTSWQYDLMGRVTQKDQIIGGVLRTTKYGFDAQGQLISLTTPAGKLISYTWTNGLITSVKADKTLIATAITYQPFGPVKSWTFGNGETINRIFDQDGRMTQNTLGTLTYDVAGRITNAYGKTYGYDNLDRLTSYRDGTTPHTYSVDATGNRTAQTVGTTTNTFAIDPYSNKILSISAGAISKNYLHDANGSIISDGTYTYFYDTANRLIQATQGATVKGMYTYNGLGQRVKKVADKDTTLFAYDEAGHLLGEYGHGASAQETVWLGDIPLASIQGNAVYHVHSDHLNTPRRITDGKQRVRWLWDVATFGATVPDENPGKGGKFVYNLRFPGQYFDSETGLHQNYFRDYDPKIGRYLQSDPIGLVGGINTYTYVGNNPLFYTDPYGLSPVGIAIGVGVRIIGGRVAAAAIAAGARSLLGPTVGGIAACVLAGICTLDETNEEVDKSCPTDNEHVDLTGGRRKHILDGDETGGGHGHGRNTPGKSEFPEGWSDDEVIDAISDVATDPNSGRKPGRHSRTLVRGTRNGLDIEVVVEPNGKIVTGYPTNVPRNPK